MITLTVRKLSKKYGKQIVFRDLTFSTSAGVVGIAGQNGSGKSTLLLCLAGLLQPTAGTIGWSRYNNDWNGDKLNHELGFAAPYLELYEGLSCMENLKFLIDLNRKPPAVEDIAGYLELFEADSYLEKNYGELSTGQRQRVKLAASTLQNPSILCLDEPGSNLDRKGKQLILKMVDECRERGTMVLIASNQKEELSLCDEIINLDETGKPEPVS
ncbi:MAG: ATP-binding cassette domain-containing protein [Balneolaceae bacterium]